MVTNNISFNGQTKQNHILASLPPVGHTNGVSENERPQDIAFAKQFAIVIYVISH